MTKPLESSDQSAEQIANDLTDGLKSCRAMLDDYRAMISGALSADNSNEPDALEHSSSG